MASDASPDQSRQPPRYPFTMAGFTRFLRDRGKSEAYIRFASIAVADRLPDISWWEYWKGHLGSLGLAVLFLLVLPPPFIVAAALGGKTWLIGSVVAALVILGAANWLIDRLTTCQAQRRAALCIAIPAFVFSGLFWLFMGAIALSIATGWFDL
jgi:hypothetical protein